MNMTEYLSIILPLMGFIAFIYKELKEWRSEVRQETSSIREEIKVIRSEIQAQSQRTDQIYSSFQEESRAQIQRTDRLYEMFIALLDNKNPKTHP